MHNNYQQLYGLLTAAGYTHSHSLESCVCYNKGNTCIAFYADKILVSGEEEHTITTRSMDIYDIMMLLQVLKIINIEAMAPVVDSEKDNVLIIPRWPCFVMTQLPKKGVTAG